MRVLISAVDVAVDGLDKFVDAGYGQSLQLSSRQFGEEAFDEVEPRRRCRNEVEVHPRVFCEPSAYLGMLVRGIVIEDHVDLELRGHRALDGAKEPQELLVAMSRHALVDDLAGGDIECCEQRRGAVPLIVVCHRPGASLLQRQARLRSVQGLDLALFVERKDHSAFRRIDVEAHYVSKLLDEVGIGGELEVLDAMRLQAMGPPYARDRRWMNAHLLGHQAATPMRRLRRFLLQRLPHDLGLIIGRDPTRPTRTRSIREHALHSTLLKAVEPQRHRRPRNANLFADAAT